MTSDPTYSAPVTSYLQRPEGRIGYEVAGSGPLLVLVPGMGDLRGTYRFLAPGLRAAGYRVAATDLRGHGDSDITFTAYGDRETADDVVALIEHLGGPAVVVGNSMAAGAAVLAAAHRPELVTGLVLVGPFVRNPAVGAMQRMMLRAAMAAPWAAICWRAYLPKLYAGQRPVDFAAYRDEVVAAVRRPGYSRAFSLTTRTDHAPAEAELSQVSAPAMIVMGERDPDFPDPRGEADWIAAALNAEVLMVPDAGHYPQSQRPDVVTPAILRFLAKVNPHA
jgi:pimeloyl-ACP methyl ester carboxylesterase